MFVCSVSNCVGHDQQQLPAQKLGRSQQHASTFALLSPPPTCTPSLTAAAPILSVCRSTPLPAIHRTDVVGQKATALARMFGFEVPTNTKVLIGEASEIGKGEPMSYEKLCPVLGE